MLSKNKVNYIQSLYQKKQRNQDLLFIIEGVKMVNEVLEENQAIVHSIYATKKWVINNSIALNNIQVEEIEEADLKRISNIKTPNEVLAILKQMSFSKLPNALQEWIIVLDGIQDPGNLGTIIRIADWFGVKHIVCSENTTDLYNAKVIQASMGSFLRVQLHYTNLEFYLKANNNAIIYAATIDGVDYKKIKATSNGILIVGNEGNGINSAIKALANNSINIPAIGKAESLNASVATGILLAQLMK